VHNRNATQNPNPNPEPETRDGLFPPTQLAQDRLERVDDLVAVDAALRKAEAQIELLRGRPVGKNVLLRPARLRPGGLVAQLLACGAPLAGTFLDHRGT